MVFPFSECYSCSNSDSDWFGLTCTVITPEERKPPGERCRFYEPEEPLKQEREQE